MRADGRELLVEFLRNSSAFSMYLAIEGDGLVWWTEDTFSRDAATKVGKARRVCLVCCIRQLLIKCLMSSLVTDFSQLALQTGKVRVRRIGGAKRVALVADGHGFGREVRDEVPAVASGDVMLSSSMNRISKDPFALGASRWRGLRDERFQLVRERFIIPNATTISSLYFIATT